MSNNEYFIVYIWSIDGLFPDQKPWHPVLSVHRGHITNYHIWLAHLCRMYYNKRISNRSMSLSCTRSLSQRMGWLWMLLTARNVKSVKKCKYLGSTTNTISPLINKIIQFFKFIYIYSIVHNIKLMQQCNKCLFSRSKIDQALNNNFIVN